MNAVRMASPSSGPNPVSQQYSRPSADGQPIYPGVHSATAALAGNSSPGHALE
jgi:hypothetical protein